MGDTFWAAFGGGAAAGIFTLIALLFVEWLRWFLDRPLLKVGMTFAFVYNHPMFQQGIRYVCLEAKNPHSKPVTVSRFGLAFKSEAEQRLQMFPDGTCQFPYEVKGGQAVSQRTTEQQVFAALRELGRKPSDLEGVWFESESGKVFRGKISHISMHVLEEAFQAQVAGTK